jgi:hypothetical protein
MANRTKETMPYETIFYVDSVHCIGVSSTKHVALHSTDSLPVPPPLQGADL